MSSTSTRSTSADAPMVSPPRPFVLRQAALGAHPARGRLPRRRAQGAQQLPPRAQPRSGGGAAQLGHLAHGGGRRHHPRPRRRRPRSTLGGQPSPCKATSAVAAFFAEEVRRQLAERYGEEALYGGGLLVRTTLDPRLQALAEESLREGLLGHDRRRGWRGPLREKVARFAWRRLADELELPEGAEGWQAARVLSRARKRGSFWRTAPDSAASLPRKTQLGPSPRAPSKAPRAATSCSPSSSHFLQRAPRGARDRRGAGAPRRAGGPRGAGGNKRRAGGR